MLLLGVQRGASAWAADEHRSGNSLFTQAFESLLWSMKQTKTFYVILVTQFDC